MQVPGVRREPTGPKIGEKYVDPVDATKAALKIDAEPSQSKSGHPVAAVPLSVRPAGPGRLRCVRAHDRSILVIDDDVMVRTMATTLLVQMGCRATGVATSDEATEALARSVAMGDPVAVVFLDLRLEREVGADVCRRLRSDGFDVPIICMSGDGFPLDAMVRSAGFDGAIHKPFSAHDLHACVERHAGEKHGSHDG
jgi:CheY-like chemotaxis protein